MAMAKQSSQQGKGKGILDGGDEDHSRLVSEPVEGGTSSSPILDDLSNIRRVLDPKFDQMIAAITNMSSKFELLLQSRGDGLGNKEGIGTIHERGVVMGMGRDDPLQATHVERPQDVHLVFGRPQVVHPVSGRIGDEVLQGIPGRTLAGMGRSDVHPISAGLGRPYVDVLQGIHDCQPGSDPISASTGRIGDDVLQGIPDRQPGAPPISAGTGRPYDDGLRGMHRHQQEFLRPWDNRSNGVFRGNAYDHVQGHSRSNQLGEPMISAGGRQQMGFSKPSMERVRHNGQEGFRNAIPNEDRLQGSKISCVHDHVQGNNTNRQQQQQQQFRQQQHLQQQQQRQQQQQHLLFQMLAQSHILAVEESQVTCPSPSKKKAFKLDKFDFKFNGPGGFDLGMDFSKEKKCHLDSNSENKIGIKEREALPMTKLSEENVVIQSSKITNTVRNMDRGDKDMLKHLCDRASEWKKNGGRHTCSERGCPLSSSRISAQISDNWDSHLCQLGCSEKWRCGQHSCQPLCHSGHCLPCLETIFSYLSCVWGKTVILPPLPYGNPPPSCQQPCSVPQPYGHLAIHSCHFGDWPPCSVRVAKGCIGRYVVLRNVLCVSKDIRYNQLCGKTRQCGMLACARTCQPLPCDSASGASSGSKVSCGQVCGASRRDCRHACTATSHPYYPCPDIRCEISVPITCSCGRITANVPYDAGMNLMKHILLKHVLLGCIIINHALLKHVLDKFVEIGRGSMEYNVNEFEDAMLKDTAFNYSRKAYNWILEDSCPDHMLQVENCLTREKDRVAHSLHSSSEHRLRGKVQHELLLTYASQLPEQEHSGCHVLLRDDKVGDLSGVKQVENAARAKKVEKLDVVGLQEQIIVRKVINLRDKYLAYANECYTNSSFFFTRLLRKLSKLSAIRVSLEAAVLSFLLLLVTIFFCKEVEATNKSLAEMCSERPPPTLLL